MRQHAEVDKLNVDIDAYETDFLIREKEIAAMIEKEIAAMPPRMREVYDLKFKQYWTTKAIAAELGISEHTVDPKDEISWKDEYLTFHNESLESMMNKISRWYNVPVIYCNDNMSPMTEEPVFTGEALSSIELRSLLELVNHTGIVNLKLESNQIIVSRNGGSIHVK